MIAVGLEGVSRNSGGGEGLKPTSLDVEHGETVVLLGPSGSGKSTLLKIVGGFERPDTGTVMLGGRDVTLLSPEERSTVMVFQSHALWPHLTVFDNVAFGLRVRKQSSAQIRERVHQMLELVRLDGYAKRHPVICRVVSDSAWLSRELWRSSPRYCCSMSRSRRWTPVCATNCAKSCVA